MHTDDVALPCACLLSLIDSVKESPAVTATPSSPATPSTPPAPVTKSRITKKKSTTKLVLPAGDDNVPETSQEEPTTDLSQDFFPDLSQKCESPSCTLAVPMEGWTDTIVDQSNPRDGLKCEILLETNSISLAHPIANGSNSNSVLLSSLSRNRFSLGNIPVAKLKKSSKNPFASSSSPAAAASPVKVPKKRGRPAKVKQ